MVDPSAETSRAAALVGIQHEMEGMNAQAYEGKDNSLLAHQEDLAEEVAEIRADPRVVKEALDSLQSDTVLMFQALEAGNNKRARLKEKIENNKALNFVKIASNSFVTSSVVGLAVRSTVHVGAPVASAITGAATGALMGWLRGKSHAESAERWMAELGFTGFETYEDLYTKKNDYQLETLVGVIDQAIKSRKIKGGATTLFKLANIYRMARNILAKRAEYEVKVPEDEEADKDLARTNFVIKALSEKIKTERCIGEQISTYAVNDRNKGLFKQLLEGRRKEIWSKTLQGMAVGAGVGFVVGSVVSWLFSKVEAVAHTRAEAAAGAKASSIIDSDVAKNIRLEHSHHLDIYNSSQDVSTPLTNMQRDVLLDHRGMVEQLSQVDAKLSGSEHLSGFGAEQAKGFKDALASGNLHVLRSLADSYNFDLHASIAPGVGLEQFLISHKPELVSNQWLLEKVISYPSLAKDLVEASTALNSAVSNAAAVSALSKVLDVLGLVGTIGAVGFGMIYGKKLGKDAAKDIRNAGMAHDSGGGEDSEKYASRIKSAEDAAEAKVKAEEKAAEEKAKAEEKKKEDEINKNIETSRTALTGRKIFIRDGALITPLGSTSPEFRREYVVEDIPKHEGVDIKESILKFRKTKDDELLLSQGLKCHPTIGFGYLLDANGRLDLSKIEVITTPAAAEGAATEGDAQKWLEAEERLEGVEVKARLLAEGDQGKLILIGVPEYRGTKFKVNLSRWGSVEMLPNAGEGADVDIRINGVVWRGDPNDPPEITFDIIEKFGGSEFNFQSRITEEVAYKDFKEAVKYWSDNVATRPRVLLRYDQQNYLVEESSTPEIDLFDVTNISQASPTTPTFTQDDFKSGRFLWYKQK